VRRGKRVAAFLLLSFALSCSDVESPTEVPIDSIIIIQRLESTPLRADGMSTTTIRAQLPAEATVNDVTFRTDLGKFLGASGDGTSITAKADEQGRVDVVLATGTTSGTAHLSASVSNFLVRADVVFLPANPDSLSVETNNSSVARDGKRIAVITVYLVRHSGTVSTGVPVTFTATQIENGQARTVGRFTGLDGARSSNLQKATATFLVDTGDAVAGVPITIRVSALNDQGSPVTAELTLGVTETA
jgi:hypothetical protein